jgi:hypothetical protein
MSHENPSERAVEYVRRSRARYRPGDFARLFDLGGDWDLDLWTSAVAHGRGDTACGPVRRLIDDPRWILRGRP